MPNTYSNRHVTDEERRDFLKALGVGSTVAVGSVTLSDVREALTSESATDLAPVGQAIQADLTGALDAGLLDSQQATFTEQASALSAVVEEGLPETEPRHEFQQVATAGQSIYDHLLEVGFFESTTQHLPEFTPEYLEKSVQAFVNSAALATPLAQLGLSGEEGVDLLATTVANAQQISDYHWVATDQIPREQIEFGEHIPPMTQGAAGGVLLWFDDLDTHLWQKRVLLTDEILSAAVWNARAMAVGFQLMSEGAKAIAEGSTLSDSELGALLSTGFAVQAISQNLLAQDVYWITEDMRGPRRTNLKSITE